MEIKPGMRVRLKPLEELTKHSTHTDLRGGLENEAWGDNIPVEMFMYLGNVVTVNGVNRSGGFDIIEDSGEWNWLPVWVDEIVADGAENSPDLTLRLTMYEQFREKGYFFSITDKHPNALDSGWVIQAGNINRREECEWFNGETLQDAWDEVVAWFTSTESF